MRDIIEKYLCASDDEKIVMENTVLDICNMIRDLSHSMIVEQFRLNKVESIISTDIQYDVCDEYDVYDISYVAEVYFEKAIEDYILLIWEIYYSELCLENRIILFSLLEKVIDLLGERKYYLQKGETDFFSGFVGDYFNILVTQFFEKVEKKMLYSKELESLRKEVREMF